MTSFYTRTGDEGYTGLLGEGRVPKHDARIEALGAADEATAAFGLARATVTAPELPALIVEVQRDLYKLMAEVAATPENQQKFRGIDAARVSWLEAQTDALSARTTVPNEFILPGETHGGGALALARTITRRAERRVAALILDGALENRELLRYLNRLSSLAFVMELLENQHAGNQTRMAKGG